MQKQQVYLVEDDEQQVRAAERLSGYHDPESIEPEAPATIESRFGFALIVNGTVQRVDGYERFAVRVVNAFAVEENDVAVGVVTNDEGSVRELTEDERLRLLDFAVDLVLAGDREGGE
jgi:hypothetical protein